MQPDYFLLPLIPTLDLQQGPAKALALSGSSSECYTEGTLSDYGSDDDAEVSIT